MDFMEKVRSFLRLPSRRRDQQYFGDRYPAISDEELTTGDLPLNQHPEHHPHAGFDVFSNPLEMHSYFEKQLNEVLRQFGMFGGDSPFFGGSEFRDEAEPGFGGFGLLFGDPSQNGPSGEEHFGLEQHAPGRSLRDQYLKPGYESPVPDEKQKSDSDVDGRLDFGHLDGIFHGEHSGQRQPQPRIFSQSVITKIVRKPDGTVESHRTVKDQHGNEERTVTRKLGDKEYTVTTKTDKDGKQETIENLVNMEEQEKEGFLKREPDKLPPDWFPFNKYFS